MAEQPQRPHRPAPRADLTALIDAIGGVQMGSPAEVAATTAAALVRAGRTDADTTRFVALADQVGLDTLAALWQNSDPVSLPGALWALYLLRQWCHTSGDEVARLWRAGQHLAPADAVVAGVPEYPDALDIGRIADAVLTGAYQGDFGVALERAAAVFRVVAAGRRQLAETDPSELERAERNERAAGALGAAAGRWRAGTLH